MPKKVETKVETKTVKVKTSRPKKPQVRVTKAPNPTLVDAKVVRGDQNRILKIALGTLAIGLLAGSGVLGYFLYYIQPAEIDYLDQIVIPHKQTGGQDDASAVAQEEAPLVVVQKVEILGTPTGYLNVRKGPGTNYEKIGKVNPGEIYDLVAEDSAKGWLEIRLDASTLGWVSAQYASVK